MESLLDRIAKVAENEGITVTALERKIGASKGVLSRAMQNSTDIQAKWLLKMVENFPRYSADWLLSGEGDMLLHTHSHKAKQKQLVIDTDAFLKNIPLYDYNTMDGIVAIFSNQDIAPSGFLNIPNLPPVDGAIYVRGESMSPLIQSGDIVIYKKVALSENNIMWGQIYLLAYTFDQDSYTTVKYLRRSERPGYIRLVSENPNFDHQDIPSSSITALALVKASITFHTIE